MDNGLIVDDLIVDDLMELIQKKIDNGELNTEKVKPAVSIIGNIDDIPYPKTFIMNLHRERK